MPRIRSLELVQLWFGSLCSELCAAVLRKLALCSGHQTHLGNYKLLGMIFLLTELFWHNLNEAQFCSVSFCTAVQHGACFRLQQQKEGFA